MHTMTSSRVALLLGFTLLASAQPTAACPPAWYGIQAARLREGIPDASGLFEGQPNNNRVRMGEDILFLVKCEKLCGWDVTMKLQDQATQADLPVTFEPIVPSDYWRVRALQPLAAGMYMLTYTGTMDLNRMQVQHYVFRVEGEASAAAPQLQVIVSEAPLYEGVGRKLSCSRSGDCPFDSYQFTQNRPYARISAQAVVEPLPDDQNSLFLYRLLPAGDPTAEQSTKWDVYLNFKSVSEKRQYLRAPGTCWFTQALQVSAGQITNSEVQCFSYDADLPDTYPGSSKPCKESPDPTAFVVAWCEDNRASCAPDNPRAASMALQKACATYADACGPLLGKRTGNLGTCPP